MPAIIAQTIDLSQWTPGEDGKVRGKDKPGNLGGGPQIVFEDFESAIYQVQPGETIAHYRDLWGQFPTGTLGGNHIDNATLDFDTVNFKQGTRSLRVTMDSAIAGDGDFQAPYLQFYPKPGGGLWRFLHEMVNDYLDRGPWQFDTYNRWGFYVKTPPALVFSGSGQFNATIGTYYAAPGTLTSSNPGGHPYHRLNMPPDMWVKVQLAQHPHHLVGANGGTEHYDWNHPSAAWKLNTPGRNYIDALTRFYIDVEANRLTSGGTVWNFDEFRVWQQPEENEQQVSDICIGCRASDNLIVVTWRRDKNENDTAHEVFYSFFNPHAVGIENCISLGTVSPLGYQGSNGMTFQTTGINWTGQNKIYFAIRPVGASLFKTIDYDLTMAG